MKIETLTKARDSSRPGPPIGLVHRRPVLLSIELRKLGPYGIRVAMYPFIGSFFTCAYPIVCIVRLRERSRILAPVC